MEIKESGENYLETILMLKNRLGPVRSIDIVREMDFSKPTISIAMKRFRENGYIVMDDEGLIELTERGREIAERIYERHQILAALLIDLGVEESVAYEDACRIEHAVSEGTFRCIKQHYLDHHKGQ